MCPCAGRAPGRRFFEELRDALLGGLAFRRVSGLVVRIVRVDLEMDQAQRPERARSTIGMSFVVRIVGQARFAPALAPRTRAKLAKRSQGL